MSAESRIELIEFAMGLFGRTLEDELFLIEDNGPTKVSFFGSKT